MVVPVTKPGRPRVPFDMDDAAFILDNLVPVRQRPETPEEAHADAIARGANCEACPLYGKKLGPVMGDFVSRPHLAGLAESLGKNEVRQKRVLVGVTGQRMNVALANGGIPREKTSVFNVIGCRPENGLSMGEYLEWCKRNHPDKPSPIECCRPRAERDLKEILAAIRKTTGGVPTLFTLGAVALEWIAKTLGYHYGSRGKKKRKKGEPIIATLKDQNGAPILVTDPATGDHVLTVVPTYHPAYAMRVAKEATGMIRDDIVRAVHIALRGGVPEWEAPPLILEPTIPQIREAARIILAWSTQAGRETTMDIETDSIDVPTARIRSVQWAITLDDAEKNTLTHHRKLAMTIPLRYKSGAPYWDAKDYAEIRDVICRVHDAVFLAGHNLLSFDYPILHRLGMLSNLYKPAFDTFHAHRATTECDLPHDLGFVVRRHIDAPIWKYDADHKVSNNAEEDRDLWHYGALDSVCNGEIVQPLREHMKACGGTGQFLKDIQLAPIYAEMGYRVGLFTDEVVRGKLGAQYTVIVRQLEKMFVERAGREINPRSPAQLGQWLWGDLGYLPTLRPDGREHSEGDKASTGAPALLRLLAEPDVHPDHEAAIEALLWYKSAETILKMFIRPKRARPCRELGDVGWAEEVVVDGEVIMDRRPAVQWMPITWKLNTPSGRTASEPNEQNRPARAFAPFLVDENGDFIFDILYNQPQRGEPLNTRSMIIAPPGHVLVGTDMKQVEQRGYALAAQDQLLIKAFSSFDKFGKPIDPHTLNAAALFVRGDDPSEADIMECYYELKSLPKGKLKFLRTVAKIVQYREVYSDDPNESGAGGLFQMMAAARDKATGELTFPNLKEREAKVWHNRWHSMHPETARWQQMIVRGVRERKFVAEPLHGRRRWFPYGATKKNAPVNHTIQALCTGAMKNESLLRIHEAIPFGKWSRWTGLAVDMHDYLGVFVPESRADETAAIVRKACYFKIDGMEFPCDDVVISRNLADQDYDDKNPGTARLAVE